MNIQIAVYIYCLTLLCIVLSFKFSYMACPQHEARSFGAACGDHHRSDRGTDKD